MQVTDTASCTSDGRVSWVRVQDMQTWAEYDTEVLRNTVKRFRSKFTCPTTATAVAVADTRADRLRNRKRPGRTPVVPVDLLPDLVYTRAQYAHDTRTGTCTTYTAQGCCQIQ